MTNMHMHGRAAADQRADPAEKETLPAIELAGVSKEFPPQVFVFGSAIFGFSIRCAIASVALARRPA